jgi:hypothetical protein
VAENVSPEKRAERLYSRLRTDIPDNGYSEWAIARITKEIRNAEIAARRSERRVIGRKMKGAMFYG